MTRTHSHTARTRFNLFETIEMKPRTTNIINIRRTNNPHLCHVELGPVRAPIATQQHTMNFMIDNIRINLVSVN